MSGAGGVKLLPGVEGSWASACHAAMPFVQSFQRSNAAARAEQVGGFIVDGEEPLRLPCRFEPALDLLAFPGGPVRFLNTFVQFLVCQVVHVQPKLPQGRAVAAQFVRHDDTGPASVGDQP